MAVVCLTSNRAEGSVQALYKCVLIDCSLNWSGICATRLINHFVTLNKRAHVTSAVLYRALVIVLPCYGALEIVGVI